MMSGYRTLSETLYRVVNGNANLANEAQELERLGSLRRPEDPIGEMFSPTSLSEEEARELEEMRHSMIATERVVVTPMVNEETSGVFQQATVQPRDYGNGPNSASVLGAQRLWRVQDTHDPNDDLYHREKVAPNGTHEDKAKAARQAENYAQNMSLLADKSEPHDEWKRKAQRRQQERIRREQEEHKARLEEEK